MRHLAKRLNFYILMSVVVASLGSVGVVHAQNTRRLTGTYTNMSFHKEGWQILGEEIRIVLTQKGYQGALQFSDGAPGELVVVDLVAVGTTISFAIPDTSSHAGQFTGTLENGLLKGEFRFKAGVSRSVELWKGKSYWD